MNFLVIGLNHKTAALDLREKLAVPTEILPETLSDIKSALTPFSTEQVLISTCNRTELYLFGKDIDLISEKVEILIESGFSINTSCSPFIKKFSPIRLSSFSQEKKRQQINERLRQYDQINFIKFYTNASEKNF